jgi:hypothetical protein
LHIKAHLLVIQHEGIVPKSTPIYQKMVLYTVFMYCAAIAFMLLVVTNVITASVSMACWTAKLVDNVLQLGIVIVIMYLYRPRGRNIDQYMERDDHGDEARQREEVLLDDVNGFTPVNEQDGMRQWEEGMDLPLEPLLISSREPAVSILSSSRTEPTYELVSDTTVPA